jgi:hypothetical protein
MATLASPASNASLVHRVLMKNAVYRRSNSLFNGETVRKKDGGILELKSYFSSTSDYI